MIAINHNLSAANVANTLTSHYGRLQTSTQRLSSGLRINGAADDAAGLAIRELMRADISALHQGMRNVNDAISMIQTFDGALSVIDEKLIRMKELAEQAATGTYDSTQRLMIDSEFQAMGSEIDRIANATDFNGVKLLCTKMMTWYEDVTKFRITNPGTIDNLQLPAGINGNPVLQGANPNNYVNENNPTKTISVSLTATAGTRTDNGALTIDHTYTGPGTRYNLGHEFTTSVMNPIGSADRPTIKYDRNNNSWTVTDQNPNNNYTDITFNGPGTRLDAESEDPATSVITSQVSFILNDHNGQVNLRDFGTNNPNIVSFEVDTNNNTYKIVRSTVEITTTTADYTASYNQDNQTVTVRLTNGGTVSMKLDNPLAAGDTINFDINFEGAVTTEPEERHGVDPNQRVKIHFGTMNDSAEDYYYIKYANCTLDGLGLSDVDIQTQDKAQEALVQINDAIVKKDKIRADYGAMQNRLENTLSNLSIQAENLQAAESRISDTEVAQEMMNFVRYQILSQSAVAMLAQANNVPQMVMRLIG